ncbi:MAG: hypothetical protein JRG90_16155 [Deltaproteobacteria bacterium]|nr:hypothetical protein [Deltaproteobacteria bacterium]
MTRISTEQFVEDLARDVAPVSPLPRLRTVLLAVLGAWAITFGAMRLLGSGAAAPVGAVPHGDLRFLMIGVGAGIFAVGAMLRALAGAIPGREPEARAGARAAAIGAVAVLLACVWALVGGFERGTLDLGGSLMCMGHAVLLALLPMIGVSLFLVRAYARQPLVAAIFAATGTVALGVLAVHLSCHAGGWFHILLGHAFAPFAVGCVLAVPIAFALRARSRRGVE